MSVGLEDGMIAAVLEIHPWHGGRHVAGRDVSQGSVVRCVRRGQVVEAHVLDAVGVQRPPGDAPQDVMTLVALGHRARLEALARVDLAVADPFVGCVHAARHLPPRVQHLPVKQLRLCEVARIAGDRVHLGRIPEPLDEVHDVVVQPLVHRRLCAVVDADGQVDQPLVPRAVVQPEDLRQEVARPLELDPRLPVAEVLAVVLVVVPRALGQELLVGQVAAEREETREHRDDALVAGRLLVTDEGVVHHHVRPEVRDHAVVRLRPDGLVVGGSVEAVVVLAGDEGLDPLVRCLQQALVTRQAGQLVETAEPVSRFLPAALRPAQPAAVGLDEARQLRQMPDLSIPHQLQLVLQPPASGHRPQWKFDQRARLQRRAVADVERISPRRARQINDARDGLLGRPGRRTPAHQNDHCKQYRRGCVHSFAPSGCEILRPHGRKKQSWIAGQARQGRHNSSPGREARGSRPSNANKPRRGDRNPRGFLCRPSGALRGEASLDPGPDGPGYCCVAPLRGAVGSAAMGRTHRHGDAVIAPLKADG